MGMEAGGGGTRETAREQKSKRGAEMQRHRDRVCGGVQAELRWVKRAGFCM